MLKTKPSPVRNYSLTSRGSSSQSWRINLKSPFKIMSWLQSNKMAKINLSKVMWLGSTRRIHKVKSWFFKLRAWQSLLSHSLPFRCKGSNNSRSQIWGTRYLKAIKFYLPIMAKIKESRLSCKHIPNRYPYTAQIKCRAFKTRGHLWVGSIQACRK